MKVTCPGCGWSADVTDEKIPDGGVIATCRKCQVKFEVKRKLDTEKQIINLNTQAETPQKNMATFATSNQSASQLLSAEHEMKKPSVLYTASSVIVAIIICCLGFYAIVRGGLWVVDLIESKKPRVQAASATTQPQSAKISTPSPSQNIETPKLSNSSHKWKWTAEYAVKKHLKKQLLDPDSLKDLNCEYQLTRSSGIQVFECTYRAKNRMGGYEKAFEEHLFDANNNLIAIDKIRF